MTAVVEPPAARLAALPGVSTAGRVAAARQAGTTGRVLPVVPALAGLLPEAGLRRGSTVAVHGATSLLLALLAEVTAAGSWAAVTGVPALGLAAAAEYGADLARVALVPHPGAEFVPVVAALLDGVDLVVAHSATLPAAAARRLSARARHRGSVLVSFGSWPGADVVLSCRPGAWTGLGAGDGYLERRPVEARCHGRGAAARPVTAGLLLPATGGRPGPLAESTVSAVSAVSIADTADDQVEVAG